MILHGREERITFRVLRKNVEYPRARRSSSIQYEINQIQKEIIQLKKIFFLERICCSAYFFLYTFLCHKNL